MAPATLLSSDVSKAPSDVLPAPAVARCPPPQPRPRLLGHSAATVLGTKPSRSHAGGFSRQEVDSALRRESESLCTKRRPKQRAGPARDTRGPAKSSLSPWHGQRLGDAPRGGSRLPRGRADSSRRGATPRDKGTFRRSDTWAPRLGRTWLGGVAGPRPLTRSAVL